MINSADATITPVINGITTTIVISNQTGKFKGKTKEIAYDTFDNTGPHNAALFNSLTPRSVGAKLVLFGRSYSISTQE